MAKATIAAAASLAMVKEAVLISSITAVGAVGVVELAVYGMVSVSTLLEPVGIVVGLVTFGFTCIGLLWGAARRYQKLVTDREDLAKRIAELEEASKVAHGHHERLHRALARAGVVDEDGHAIKEDQS